jgi:hypothetical protein
MLLKNRAVTKKTSHPKRIPVKGISAIRKNHMPVLQFFGIETEMNLASEQFLQNNPERSI